MIAILEQSLVENLLMEPIDKEPTFYTFYTLRQNFRYEDFDVALISGRINGDSSRIYVHIKKFSQLEKVDQEIIRFCRATWEGRSFREAFRKTTQFDAIDTVNECDVKKVTVTLNKPKSSDDFSFRLVMETLLLINEQFPKTQVEDMRERV